MDNSKVPEILTTKIFFVKEVGKTCARVLENRTQENEGYGKGLFGYVFC